MSGWENSLVRYFESGIKDINERKLGVEVEHFIVDPAKRKAVRYSDENGVRYILSALIDHYPDAVPICEEDLFGFSVPDFNITIEPAAQLEISIAPSDRINWIGDTYRSFMKKLMAILDKLGLTAITAGCQPFENVRDLELIPKRRYDLMDKHFRKTGTGGIEMMRGTCSLQVSVDYSSEEDFRDKYQAAYFFSPVLRLLADCTPLYTGKPAGILKRTDIWRRVDPSRCGMPANVFSPSFGFKDYASFIGSIDPIFTKAGNDIIPSEGRTVSEIYNDTVPDENEVAHILSMAFPDVRLKNFIEIRFADSVPYRYMLAYCALIKGLILSSDGLLFAKKTIEKKKLSEKSVRDAESCIMEKGWDAEVLSVPVSKAAEMLIDIAGESLSEEETSYLDEFRKIIRYRGICNVSSEDTER